MYVYYYLTCFPNEKSKQKINQANKFTLVEVTTV